MVSTKSILLLVVVAVCSIRETLGQEEAQCKGKDVNLTEHQKAQITDCLTENGINNIFKIPPQRLACFGVCLLEKKGMLTEDGKIDHDKGYAYLKAAFPEEFRKPIIDGIDKCIKEHGQNVKVKDDPNCSTFMEVGQCVHDVFFEVCID